MLAVKLVEVAVVRRMVLWAVPPVPVAALCNQDFLKRQLTLRFARAGRILVVKLAGMMKVIPGPVVLRSTDPHVEVGVNPRSRNKRWKAPEIPMVRDRFRDADGLDALIVLESIVEAPQKLASRLWVILPCILPVDNHRDDSITYLR